MPNEWCWKLRNQHIQESLLPLYFTITSNKNNDRGRFFSIEFEGGDCYNNFKVEL